MPTDAIDRKEAVPFGITDHCMNIACRNVTKGITTYVCIDPYTAQRSADEIFAFFIHSDDLFRVFCSFVDLCRLHSNNRTLCTFNQEQGWIIAHKEWKMNECMPNLGKS